MAGQGKCELCAMEHTSCEAEEPKRRSQYHRPGDNNDWYTVDGVDFCRVCSHPSNKHMWDMWSHLFDFGDEDLYFIAASSHLPFTEMKLIEAKRNGVDLDRLLNGGQCTLFIAMCAMELDGQCTAEKVRLAAAYGAHPNSIVPTIGDWKGQNALHHVLLDEVKRYPTYRLVITELLAAKVDVNVARIGRNDTPLRMAIQRQLDEDIVRLLLTAGADPSIPVDVEYDEQSQMEDFGELIYAAEPVLVRDYALARGYSRVVDLLDEFENDYRLAAELRKAVHAPHSMQTMHSLFQVGGAVAIVCRYLTARPC